MPDDRIYDAINLFKYSGTGLGTTSIGGDRAYQERYRRLAGDVVAKLWYLWSSDEIGFAHLSSTLVGDSSTGRHGTDIRVNSLIAPASDSTYTSTDEQGKLAACSCNIVHEATHLVRNIASYPEEEVLCRMIQLFYFRELRQGRSYGSRLTGTQCTARFLPTTPFYSSYQNRMNRYASRDLIDNVVNNPEYRRDLETPETADFVARSLGWWNGLSNRWPSTRGYYLRSLASHGDRDYAYSILQILESILPGQWPAARSCAGDLDRIRRGLRSNYHIYGNPFTRRIESVQQRLGENFGIRSR